MSSRASRAGQRGSRPTSRTPKQAESRSDSSSSSDVDDRSDESHREQIRHMDQMFQTPFMGGIAGPGMLSLEDGRGHNRRNRHHHRDRVEQQRAQNMQLSGNHRSMDPFAHFNAMFSNMHNMMSDMHRAFGQMSSDSNAQVYQQSTYYSSSHLNGKNPKVFQATTSVRQAPGGVKETRKTVQDSETGVQSMAVGHHISDRGHIIERSRNTHTNESTEKQEFINLNEEEAPAFDQEYNDRWRSTMRGVEQRRRRIRELVNPQGSHHHHHNSRPARALPEPEASSSRRPRKASNRHE